MSYKLLVIIPAYNEEENILSVIQELRKDVSYADILVINDCSKDNTLKILKENEVNYITTPFNLGYSGVIQIGFKYAVEKDYDYVAQFDGDGQHVASELDKLFKTIQKTNADIVIGSRFKLKTEYNHSAFRKIGTWMFQKIIKRSCGQEITDPTSGLQVLNKRVFGKYSQINNYPDYPDANLLIEMLLNGYLIEEVSVEMRERLAGVSMHAGIWKPCKYMIKMFYSILIVIIKYGGKRMVEDKGGQAVG
ncbi:MAG: glycosyltransferase family 2 protein [Clostridiaceae bacterium]|jgi:glycosyltransferase involved in cell wall biosynthesis|nr:glycosyltransferase family 2 protein [Clostridiaceae bacterium]